MSIKNIMSIKVVTVRPNDLLSMAAQVMLWSGGRHLPVVESGEVVGVLSEGDLFRAARHEGGARRALVREAMTSPAKTISPTEPVDAAAGRMAAEKIGCLPVLEKGKLVGIVTTTDVMRAIERDALAKHSALEDELGVEVLSLRALRDRLRVQAHLGGMDLRDTWHDLQDEIAQAERLIASAASNAASFVRKVRGRAEKLIADASKKAKKSNRHPAPSRAKAKSKAKNASGAAARA